MCNNSNKSEICWKLSKHNESNIYTHKQEQYKPLDLVAVNWPSNQASKE